MNTFHENLAEQGLIRPRDGRVFGGVCAGLGRRFGMAPWLTRVLFIVVLLAIPGSQLIVYPLLWFLMPSEQVGVAPRTPPPAA